MTAAKYKAITIQEKKVRDRIDLLDNQKNRSDERKTRRSITIQEYRIDRLNSTTKRTGQVEEPQRAVKGERPYIVQDKKVKDKKAFHQFVFF
jgi:hypothetical protein